MVRRGGAVKGRCCQLTFNRVCGKNTRWTAQLIRQLTIIGDPCPLCWPLQANALEATGANNDCESVVLVLAQPLKHARPLVKAALLPLRRCVGCTIFSSLAESQQAFADGALGGDEFQQLEDSCDQWLSIGMDTAASLAPWRGTSVIHAPLVGAQLSAGVFLVPTPAPLSLHKAERAGEETALSHRVMACELAQLLDTAGLTAQFWACGPAAAAVCRNMEAVPGRRKPGDSTSTASVVVVDRSTDLTQAVIHGDSLLDRVTALLPSATASGRTADVAVNLCPVFPDGGADLPFGSLAHGSDGPASQLVSELAAAKHKDALLAVRKALIAVAEQHDIDLSIGRLGKPTISQLLGFLGTVSVSDPSLANLPGCMSTKHVPPPRCSQFRLIARCPPVSALRCTPLTKGSTNCLWHQETPSVLRSDSGAVVEVVAAAIAALQASDAAGWDRQTSVQKLLLMPPAGDGDSQLGRLIEMIPLPSASGREVTPGDVEGGLEGNDIPTVADVLTLLVLIYSSTNVSAWVLHRTPPPRPLYPPRMVLFLCNNASCLVPGRGLPR